MIITVYTFVTTILKLYSACRYVHERNEFFKEQFLLHINWQVFYLIVTLATIYTANLLTNEVCVLKLKLKDGKNGLNSNWIFIWYRENEQDALCMT